MPPETRNGRTAIEDEIRRKVAESVFNADEEVTDNAVDAYLGVDEAKGESLDELCYAYAHCYAQRDIDLEIERLKYRENLKAWLDIGDTAQASQVRRAAKVNYLLRAHFEERMRALEKALKDQGYEIRMQRIANGVAWTRTKIGEKAPEAGGVTEAV